MNSSRSHFIVCEAYCSTVHMVFNLVKRQSNYPSLYFFNQTTPLFKNALVLILIRTKDFINKRPEQSTKSTQRHFLKCLLTNIAVWTAWHPVYKCDYPSSPNQHKVANSISLYLQWSSVCIMIMSHHLQLIWHTLKSMFYMCKRTLFAVCTLNLNHQVLTSCFLKFYTIPPFDDFA